MLRIVPGKPVPLGPTTQAGRTNFSLFAAHATEVTLCLFWSLKKDPDEEIPLAGPIDGVWCIGIEGLLPNAFYAYRVKNRDASCHPENLLSDPYALSFAESFLWGDFSKPRRPFLCRVDPPAPFDWQGVLSPNRKLKDLILYEMHVRGFTIDPSSKVLHPGTYSGIIEKIPYLKRLGINAVELMPVFEFDETHYHVIHPGTNELLLNYWGYGPISFFIPMSRYAVHPERAADEMKTMVRELHRADIEVILDVVYNHTSEFKEYQVSFRGIDRASYYMLDQRGEDLNYSGCGNTFKTNTPPGMTVILDSLRYWVKEMHIDGFRFDLASILTRDGDGKPLSDPPILKAIANDPILKTTKLIGEPWDAGGLYQIGQFPKWGPWSTWNGQFRDHVRRFLKGTDQEAGAFATVMCGSEPLYGSEHSPQSSINFITSHDGFCLYDLVSYQEKHNLDNGEQNRDGAAQNDSWNCGAEGPTTDRQIEELRQRQLRNFWLALLLSQGVPMLLMGDEISLTRRGNNNAYVQDNELNWFNWNACSEKAAMLKFISSLIAFRKKHSLLSKTAFLKKSEVDWHGPQPLHPDWSPSSRFVAFTLKGEEPLYIAFNADYKQKIVTLPLPSEHQRWHQVIHTADLWEKQHFDAPHQGAILGSSIELPPYSALVAQGITNLS